MDQQLCIVVCTRDRSEHVREALLALEAQDPDGSVPVLLIDSASSPAHASALADMAARRPHIHMHRLERPGLSVARNRGVELAASEWVAFLDDDAVPRADWLARAQVLARTLPTDVGVVGGRILPRWPGPAPSHVGRRWLMFLSCIEAEAQDATRPQCYGANLLCRRASLQAVGGFAEELGRNGDRLLSGEETLVLAALEQLGQRIVYDGALVVEHKIGPDRLTRQWIQERAYWGGVTEVAIVDRLGLPRPWRLHPLKVAASIPVLTMMSMLGDASSDYLIRGWYARGVLDAVRRSR